MEEEIFRDGGQRDEQENNRLKKLVADLSVDKHILQEALAKSSEARAAPTTGGLEPTSLPAHRSRACGLMQLERSSYYYRVHPRDYRAVTVRLKELAAVRVRHG